MTARRCPVRRLDAWVVRDLIGIGREWLEVMLRGLPAVSDVGCVAVAVLHRVTDGQLSDMAVLEKGAESTAPGRAVVRSLESLVPIRSETPGGYEPVTSAFLSSADSRQSRRLAQDPDPWGGAWDEFVPHSFHGTRQAYSSTVTLRDIMQVKRGALGRIRTCAPASGGR